MEKKSFANRFGLIALMSLGLFASTAAFAGNIPAASPVIVTNTPAQPIPMVGLTKDSDAPARKPFQTVPIFVQANLPATFYDVVTVPANQRLVIEHVSGTCSNISFVELASYNQVVPHPFGCLQTLEKPSRSTSQTRPACLDIVIWQ